MAFRDILQTLLRDDSLTREEAQSVASELMQGLLSPVQIASLLIALRMKGETVNEMVGIAQAMRQVAVPVNPNLPLVLDSCGTGGDEKGLFNVSTAAAFVVAGAGFVVAKHGNRSVSSKCGSADLLEALGIPVEMPAPLVEQCLRDIGIAFLYAPLFHPATRHATPIRRELGVRTIFNLLGPLTNPASPHVQLIGVYDPKWLRPVAQALREMGTLDAVVVHGQGADEIVLSGPTQIVELVDGELHIDEWWPKDFGVEERRDEHLLGGLPKHNADILLDILSGHKSAYRDAVCMNAAALIRVASRSARGQRKTLSLQDAFQWAAYSIDSQAASAKLHALQNVRVGGSAA